MKISVVTVVYNRMGTIADAIHSVRSQEHPSHEHVIQDGNSTDGTLAVLEQMSHAQMSIVSEPDGGIYDAINRGINRTSGDIIGLMHSDDFFANEHVLSKVSRTFGATDADGVYGDLEYVAIDDPTRDLRYWRSGEYSPTSLKYGWMPPHPTLYLRREVFDRYGLYDTNFRISADYDAILRYLIRGNIRLAYIPEVLVKMRVGGESNRSLSHILRKSQEDLVAIRRNGVGGIGTLALKNLSKIGQFVSKGSRAPK